MHYLNRLNAALFLAACFLCIGCGGSNQKSPTAPESHTSANQPAPAAESGKKAQLLKGLVGEHRLVAVSGFMGANTMVDYYLENGKWTATASSISGGKREGYDAKLSAEALAKLQSMKIVVAEDLSVALLCKGKTYCKTPFQEQGMNYALQKPVDSYSADLPKDLNAGSTFVEHYLYLYANDGLSEQDLNDLDILPIGAEAVAIRYNTESKAFDLLLFPADCCDNSSYTFKK